MIKVLGDRVLVALRPSPDEIVSESGIVLVKDPDAAKTPTQGVVMALGEKADMVSLQAVLDVLAEHSTDGEDYVTPLRALGPAAFDVELGDVVIFSRGAGDQFAEDGVNYVVLFESEILGVCEPLSTEEAA